MAYHNNSNNQTTSQVSDRLPPGYYRKKAMTKARQGLDGSPNRGILISDPQTGREQWVSIPTDNEVCRLPYGSQVYYHGHGSRPSLTFNEQVPQHFDNGGVPPTNQYQADQYARQAEFMPSVYEQIHQSYNPPNQQTEIQYDNNHLNRDSHESVQRSESVDNLNENYLNKISMLMSMCLAMAEEICPQGYTSEQKQKVGTTLFLQYTKDINIDIPF